MVIELKFVSFLLEVRTKKVYDELPVEPRNIITNGMSSYIYRYKYI